LVFPDSERDGNLLALPGATTRVAGAAKATPGLDKTEQSKIVRELHRIELLAERVWALADFGGDSN
jgi:hypothetical protein